MVTDAAGNSLMFGICDFRNAAAAETAVRLVHNTSLDTRYVFLRQDCDMAAHDGADVPQRAAQGPPLPCLTTAPHPPAGGLGRSCAARRAA